MLSSSRPLSYWEASSGLAPSTVTATPPQRCDVLIVGAGFTGAWLAFFLKKKHPTLQVVIVERDYFTRLLARSSGYRLSPAISSPGPVLAGWRHGRSRDRGPDRAVASAARAEPGRPGRPRPATVVACPLTFNTANKLVTGIMDTPVVGRSATRSVRTCPWWPSRW